MSKVLKLIACCIGIIVGIAIIFIGFEAQKVSSTSIGTYMKFGADFYSEIYLVTMNVGKAVNNVNKNICETIGWLIISLGAIDICYFVNKLCSLDFIGEKNNKNAKCSKTPTDDEGEASNTLGVS